MCTERRRTGTAAALVLMAAFPVFLAAAGQISSAAQADPRRARKAIAVETFLADIARNVAGKRMTVEALLPVGVDPHGYEPTPKDVKRVAESGLLIVNGAGLEGFVERLVREAGGSRTIIEASAGLARRTLRHAPGGEETDGGHERERGRGGMNGRDRAHAHGEVDPHFWLDPVLVLTYVDNIRKGFTAFDPEGAAEYAENAKIYAGMLRELDRWIVEQVGKIPERSRVLVTNHESLGYFADRYGFRIVGAVIPSASTGSSPSARELAALADAVRRSGVRAVFLETGSNPKLARQLADETGIEVVRELLTHSITGPKGGAPSYIDMMRYNTSAIVEALR